jgi:lyso-ornithine lipid O-acyltransferase
MAAFRRLYRISGIILWSISVAILSIPAQLMGGWKGIKGVNYFSHLWIKGVAKIINLRVRVRGKMPDIPGALIVSNHVSYLDIITHGSVLALRYSPKSDIAKWPVLGWYLGLSRPVWTDRSSKQASKKTLRDFVKTMKHGIHLIVYPEGTSTDGKNGMLPFKSTSFEAAIIGNVAIQPVLTRYRQAPGEHTVCWYGDMTLLPHVWQVLKLPSIEAELHFLPAVIPNGLPRKELASFVRDRMVNEYEGLRKAKQAQPL